MRSSTKKNWKYKGCSDHKVPSLSKVAILSLTGIKSAEVESVTFSTKSVIEFFTSPSFHEGNGSVIEVTIDRSASLVDVLQFVRKKIMSRHDKVAALFKNSDLSIQDFCFIM